jgi:hypothetical protein
MDIAQLVLPEWAHQVRGAKDSDALSDRTPVAALARNLSQADLRRALQCSIDAVQRTVPSTLATLATQLCHSAVTLLVGAGTAGASVDSLAHEAVAVLSGCVQLINDLSRHASRCNDVSVRGDSAIPLATALVSTAALGAAVHFVLALAASSGAEGVAEACMIHFWLSPCTTSAFVRGFLDSDAKQSGATPLGVDRVAMWDGCARIHRMLSGGDGPINLASNTLAFGPTVQLQRAASEIVGTLQREQPPWWTHFHLDRHAYPAVEGEKSPVRPLTTSVPYTVLNLLHPFPERRHPRGLADNDEPAGPAQQLLSAISKQHIIVASCGRPSVSLVDCGSKAVDVAARAVAVADQHFALPDPVTCVGYAESSGLVLCGTSAKELWVASASVLVGGGSGAFTKALERQQTSIGSCCGLRDGFVAVGPVVRIAAAGYADGQVESTAFGCSRPDAAGRPLLSRTIAASLAGTRLVTHTADKLTLWDVERDDEAITAFDGGRFGTITCVAGGAETPVVAAGFESGTVAIYDPRASSALISHTIVDMEGVAPAAIARVSVSRRGRHLWAQTRTGLLAGYSSIATLGIPRSLNSIAPPRDDCGPVSVLGTSVFFSCADNLCSFDDGFG